MSLRKRLVELLLVIVIVSPLASLSPSIPLAHAQGTMITLGQPVTGTLSQQNPEDWWGVNFPRGEINITLTVPKANTADLAFAFSPFQSGTPIGESYPFLANVIHSPGSNQTFQFVAPSTDPLATFPFLVPGPSAIRVFSPSSNYGKTGSVTYTLTVLQLLQFTTIATGNLNSFDNVRAGNPLLYSFNAPTVGAYNVTMKANATSSSLAFHVTAYEGDFYLPMSDNDLTFGQSSMLMVLSSTVTTYLIVTPNLNPSPSTKPLKGNVTVSYKPLPTISPGQQITGTLTGAPNFYLTNLPVGSYYNFTLTPPVTMAARLDIYSPVGPGSRSGNLTSGIGSSIGSSTTPGFGVVQKVRNLVVFYLSSYSFTNSSGYRSTAGSTIPGPRPDKVLVRVNGTGIGSYTLKLDTAPFPQLASNTPVNLKLSPTNGPYYSFYRGQSGPGAYTETLPYTVTNSTASWASEIDLIGVIQELGSFDLNQVLRTYTLFLLGPISKNQVETWPAINERDFITNNNFFHQNTTIQLGYGTVLPATPYLGAALGPLFYGNSTIKATLSYNLRAPTNIVTGVQTSDFLSGLNVNLYTISLTAGTTYRLDDTHTSASETWELFDPTTGLTVPTQGPFLAPGVSTDPNQAQTADYLYFTAPATATYYLAAGINPGPLISGPNPAGFPEEHYTFTVSAISSSPSSTTQLSVTLSSPPTATAGQTIKIKGTVTNAGSNNANNVVVSITLPGELSTTQSLSTAIGTLTPGQSALFSWTLTTSGSGTVTAAVVTSSDNAAQNVKTSSVNISAAGSSASFISSPTNAALITGVLAAVIAVSLGFVVGRRKKQLPTGSPTGTIGS
ncbi:MAG TPA: CARDB domain-containing protein [Candidatus Bathyarchaeia archaeon]|nr:CARDB domain-containing protein [Candidatus Bathyarchaeia archaeon]